MKKVVMLFLVISGLSYCGGGGGGGGNPSNPAPGAVTMTFATISSTGFSFGWIEPDNTDLASIRIAYKGPSDTDFNTLTVLDAVDPVLVPDRSNNWISPGGFVSLTIGARYEITITAIDTGNNETTVSFKLTNAGDQNNYYFIYTADDLNALRGGVTGYADWDSSADGFVLMNDISLDAYSSGEGWVPIGNETTPFSKIVEGNGHKITGLVISRSSSNQGLFGYIGTTGRVNDLSVSGTVSGPAAIGGLAGYNEGTITGCDSSVTVSGSAGFIGGLVGSNYGTINNSSSAGNVSQTAVSGEGIGGLAGFSSGLISGSFSTATVSGSVNSIGGLVGYVASGTVDNCYATGAVTGTDDYLGGLIGYVAWATITDSYATGGVTGSTTDSDNVGGFVGYINGGTITGSYATGSVTGDVYIGGLIGGNNEGEITGYHTTGAVNGNEQVGGLIGRNTGGPIGSGSYSEGTISGILYVGGLIGYLGSGTVTGSHSHCTVTGSRHVGGLAGLNSSGISLSYATGSATATAGGNDDNVGGLVGSCVYGTITNCYARGNATGYGSLGGLVGYMDNASISYCYSTGAVNGTGNYRGGLVGYFGSGSAPSFCYYDKDTSGMEDTNGTPTTTADMKLQGTFTGWDFISDANGSNDYWSIDNTGTINNGYPYLTDNAPAN